jgi:hypothetical protein
MINAAETLRVEGGPQIGSPFAAGVPGGGGVGGHVLRDLAHLMVAVLSQAGGIPGPTRAACYLGGSLQLALGAPLLFCDFLNAFEAWVFSLNKPPWSLKLLAHAGLAHGRHGHSFTLPIPPRAELPDRSIHNLCFEARSCWS